jgi:hypothetical protein
MQHFPAATKKEQITPALASLDVRRYTHFWIKPAEIALLRFLFTSALGKTAQHLGQQ